MNLYQNILIVSGSGRNSGKTTFICRLINHYSLKHKIVAIKISPHFHDEISENPVIVKSSGFIIEKEINPDKSKDSSRMLKAGASEVYYIQTNDEYIKEAVDYILNLTGKKVPVVCESGGLAIYIKPGLHVFMKNENYESKGAVDYSDISLSLQELLNFDLSVIQFKNKWQKI